LTDQEIYAGIKRKDNATFSYMYKEYKSMIISMIQKNNGNEADALDIFQEGLVAMWSNIDQDKYVLNEKARLSTYLYALCRNIWISRLRKTQPTKQFEINDDFEVLEEVDEMEAHYEMISNLEKQFSKLNESCRNLLQRFYYEKSSLKEIALIMNITEKTAKNNKYRCMQNLRSLYEKNDLDEN
jgi:RNA polymerase sigma factor (sigma-70 family)